MTNIAVSRTNYQVENRAWLASEHGTEPGANIGITLDISLFTEATHYPDGYLRSGIVVAKVTATGLYGPYSNAASDGREVARGHLFASLPVKGQTKVGGALFEHGFVTESKLPPNHGLDSAGKTDLSLIRYR